jgi:hypothetical protein
VKPDFSIVTPSFNQAQFVRYTLESVRRQQGVTVQHVVVDPGSTDGSQDVIRTFDNVDFVQKPDSCQSQGINNGFAECVGRYMAWLNSDDIYPTDDVLRQVKNCFEANPNVDIVYGNAIFIDDQGNFIKKYFVNSDARGLGASLEYQVGICQPAVFWRREVYESLGGLDESLNYQLDFEYWIRMCQAGKVWKHLNADLAAHRWWAGMKTSSKRDLSLRESLNLVKQRFGYVHPKWCARLAALEIDASDGIINQSSGNEAAVAQRTAEIVRASNTDPATLELIQRADANSSMQFTLQALKSAGVSTEVLVRDCKDLAFKDAAPRFLHPGDEKAASIARRPEIREAADGSGPYLLYAAEPNYRMAQRLSDFERSQKELIEYLKSCKAESGKTCVVVANGPSLNRSINEDLFANDLIISNFAYKDERLCQHAKYFTIVNHTVAAQVYADWRRIEHLVKFFPFWLGRHIPQLPNTYYVNSTVMPNFSADALRDISWRSTVSYFNLQLAYSLGYRRILLVGFDNSYVQPEAVREGDEILQTADDPNHFLKDYFKGKTWQAADTGNMNDSYCEALVFAMQHDVEIINCTVGGQLHVFPRSSLSSLVGAKEKLPPGLQTGGRWMRLTPGEILATMRFPTDMRSMPQASYSRLPDAVKNFLLAQARSASRAKVAPYGYLNEKM